MRGEYVNTIDDKGRLMIPPKFRSELGEAHLVLTRSFSNCLWLFTEEEYEKFASSIMDDPAAMLDIKTLNVTRRLVAACQDVDFDKTGRICIPQNFRKFAMMEPRTECTILGNRTYIEIWNTDHYSKQMDEVDKTLEEDASVLCNYLRSKS
ncbi:MAG: division/cell wall cluster transcriptional repressor MraZ [Sphaerochaetaceae bacterium]|nr:division/cell wall cluster transcriptional repressor MraZ [Sphaerochaetaceae bacterium]MDD3163102.1 division/cell wall cluster transcriptional repressor MraZ [Sphaerochaetaceae bacterium]MDD4007346.1 division/cell wall cluster transcriptional repressor MraZ [Sphaerochaetaceae bacterium]MDD4396893.1 division/cell wall cluster transcriptional repressor MraZ [Sphaerochaetaceae bacterium]